MVLPAHVIGGGGRRDNARLYFSMKANQFALFAESRQQLLHRVEWNQWWEWLRRMPGFRYYDTNQLLL
jgi:hypothetical protein